MSAVGFAELNLVWLSVLVARIMAPPGCLRRGSLVEFDWMIGNCPGLLSRLIWVLPREIWGMFIRSAWNVTCWTKSEKLGKASLPFRCCSPWTTDDHFAWNQLGSLSISDCSLDGYSNIFSDGKCSLAMATCSRKSLKSRKPCASLFSILGQFVYFFSKSVATMADLPKRCLSFFLACM